MKSQFLNLDNDEQKFNLNSNSFDSENKGYNSTLVYTNDTTGSTFNNTSNAYKVDYKKSLNALLMFFLFIQFL